MYPFEEYEQRLQAASLLQRQGELDKAYAGFQVIAEELRLAIAEADSSVLRQLNVVLCQAITGLGNVEAIRGNNREALEFYTTVLEKAEEISDVRSIVGMLCNIGSIYTHVDDFERAMDYQQQALELAIQENVVQYQANILCNLAGIHMHFERNEQAMQMFEESRKLYEELGDQRGVVLTTINIAALLSTMQRFDESVPLFLEMLPIAESLNDRYNMVLILDSLGQIYRDPDYSLYDLVQSEQLYRRALDISHEMDSKANQTYLHKSLSDLFRQKGEWQKALEHFDVYHKLELETNSLEVKQMAQKLGYEREAAQREKEIEVQRARSATTRSLLHRVLPESIAERMMNEEEEIADYFPNVSILFADIRGFTTLSAKMPAQIVVRVLGQIFGEYDRIIRSHGCEKIKTMGDGYMAIAGAPVICDDHALRLSKAAQEMLHTVRLPDLALEYMTDAKDFAIRIGLHCGPVVAGVVGRDRFVYDVYSDAVNTASRMESHGVAGRIHCSEEFIKQLQNHEHSCTITPRGEIEVKGKGVLKTYFID